MGERLGAETGDRDSHSDLWIAFNLDERSRRGRVEWKYVLCVLRGCMGA